METGIAPAREFMQALRSGRADAFDLAVTMAYASGATHEELVQAIATVERLGSVPPSAVAQAYMTVYYWSWMAAPRAAHLREPMARAA